MVKTNVTFILNSLLKKDYVAIADAIEEGMIDSADRSSFELPDDLIDVLRDYECPVPICLSTTDWNGVFSAMSKILGDDHLVVRNLKLYPQKNRSGPVPQYLKNLIGKYCHYIN